MYKRRVFISIDLPENLKDRVEKKLEEIRYEFTNDIRFIDRKNWHITLSFLGSQTDEAIGNIVESIRSVVAQFQPPEIEFTDIGYGPTGKTPRMIWLNGSLKTSKELHAIKDRIENDLIDRGVVFKREHRQMKVHVTLARFESVASLPDVQQDVSLRFFAKSIDLMESQLSPSGAQYEVLQKSNFRT
jgi:2'-5' RNA ligase